MTIDSLSSRPVHAAADAAEVERRIQDLLHVKALCGPLKPAKERHFIEVIGCARRDAAARSSSEDGAIRSALDLLSLELCDD
jgi:hypothetical protein